MATHSSILAWKSLWTEEAGGLYSPWNCKKVRHDLTNKQQLYSTENFVHTLCVLCVCVSCSAMSDSLRSCGLQPTRLLSPWDSPGKNIGVGCHFLLRRIFPTQGLNLCLLSCRQILYYLNSILYNNLNGKRFLKRIDTYITESLCCTI